MKRRDNEDLIRLAFGELTREEAAKVESSLDAEAQGEVMLFERMRSDMQLLKDIPEPQISTERLREAILTRGLKQKPSWRSWSWVLAPGLAGVVLAGLLMGRNTAPSAGVGGVAMKQDDSISPVVADVFSPMQTELINLSQAAKDEVSFGTSTDEAHAMTAIPTASSKVQNKPVPVVRPAKMVVNVHRHSRPAASVSPSYLAFNASSSQPEEKSVDAQPQEDFAAAPSPVADSLMKPDVVDSNLKVSEPEKSSDKIIVVNGARDRETGAATATEVGSNADVIVGG